MLENIKLSFRGVWSHKMRSFLTMLGIIIGIAAIIAIVSTIQGTNKQIEKNLIGSGSNTVKVELQQDGYSIDLSYQELPVGIGQISDAAMEEIQKLDNVESASKYHSRNVYDGVYYQNTSLSGGYVYGIDSTYLGTNSMVVERGRGITDADMSSRRKVALVDEKAAKTLFQGEDCLGRTIEIQQEPYVIVGIVGEKEKYDLVINSIDDYYTYAGSDSSGNVYVPDTTWPIIYQFDEPENLIVRASDTSTMTTVGKGAADILNGYISTSDDTIKYAAQDLLEQAKELQDEAQSGKWNDLNWNEYKTKDLAIGIGKQAGQAEKERDRAQYAVDPGDPDAAGGGSADSLLRGKGPGARVFAGGNCQIDIMCITGGGAKIVLRPCFFQWGLVQYYQLRG